MSLTTEASQEFHENSEDLYTHILAQLKLMRSYELNGEKGFAKIHEDNAKKRLPDLEAEQILEIYRAIKEYHKDNQGIGDAISQMLAEAHIKLSGSAEHSASLSPQDYLEWQLSGILPGKPVADSDISVAREDLDINAL